MSKFPLFIIMEVNWIRGPSYSIMGFPSSSNSKESACNGGEPGLIPGLGRAMEKSMATDSSILAWRIPWREEPSGLHYSPWGHKESDTTEQLTHALLHYDLILTSATTWFPNKLVFWSTVDFCFNINLGRHGSTHNGEYYRWARIIHGKDWGQEEKGTTEDGIVAWPHSLNEHEFEQTIGDSEG